VANALPRKISNQFRFIRQIIPVGFNSSLKAHFLTYKNLFSPVVLYVFKAWSVMFVEKAV
jgi:hypothetical protein